jgi:hypothetical protein
MRIGTMRRRISKKASATHLSATLTMSSCIHSVDSYLKSRERGNSPVKKGTAK